MRRAIEIDVFTFFYHKHTHANESMNQTANTTDCYYLLAEVIFITTLWQASLAFHSALDKVYHYLAFRNLLNLPII